MELREANWEDWEKEFLYVTNTPENEDGFTNSYFQVYYKVKTDLYHINWAFQCGGQLFLYRDITEYMDVFCGSMSGGYNGNILPFGI